MEIRDYSFKVLEEDYPDFYSKHSVFYIQEASYLPENYDRALNNTERRVARMMVESNKKQFTDGFAHIMYNDGTIRLVDKNLKVLRPRIMPTKNGFYTIKVAFVPKNSSNLLNYPCTIQCMNSDGLYLLDQTKIKSRRTILNIIMTNPLYLEQIPQRFFTPKNNNLFILVAKKHYKKILEISHNKSETYEFVKNRMERVEQLIKERTLEQTL